MPLSCPSESSCTEGTALSRQAESIRSYPFEMLGRAVRCDSLLVSDLCNAWSRDADPWIPTPPDGLARVTLSWAPPGPKRNSPPARFGDG